MYVNGTTLGQPESSQAGLSMPHEKQQLLKNNTLDLNDPLEGRGVTSAPRNVLETPNVYRAICKVIKALSRDGIAKGGKNEQQGYRFRGIDDIYNGLSAPLDGADLCILPRMISRTQEERVTAKGAPLFSVVVEAEFDFVSAADGSKHTVSMFGEAMDSADKATNKAMSAAYKYACQEVFCIPTEGMAEDADATTPAPALTPKPAKEEKTETGGNPVGTQAAADYVAQKKIEELKQQKRWSTFGEMKKFFSAVREEVGEYEYLGVLEKFEVRSAEDFRDPKKAEECFANLLAIARRNREVA